MTPPSTANHDEHRRKHANSRVMVCFHSYQRGSIADVYDVTDSHLICFHAPGNNGLSEDLQGGETPATPQGSGGKPETKVSHDKEEQSDKRPR